MYWSSRTMSVQKRPATRQIQPIGFSGRLEAIRAPTIVKARKGVRINSLPMAPPEPQSLEGCAIGAVRCKDKTVSMAPATNMAPESAASDQASQEAARVLIPRSSDPGCSYLLSRYHSTAVPSPRRYEARYGAQRRGKPLRTPLACNALTGPRVRHRAAARDEHAGGR